MTDPRTNELDRQYAAEIVKRDADLFGSAFTYDGVALDPTKVVMYRRNEDGGVSRELVEHGVLMAGGGVHIRPNQPEIERIFPLNQWINLQLTVQRSRVVRRRVIVVEDWVEITEPVAEED